MELTVSKRTPGKKCEIKNIRREGNIPAVLYSQGNVGEEIVVDGAAFKKILNEVQQGTLSTKIFSLKHQGKTLRALLKDIQYNVVTYDVMHLDFIELHDEVPVSVNIPIQCTGVMDCVGVKLGGNLRQVLRYFKVRCLPKDIPSVFEVDVRDLNVNDAKRLGDIQLPESIRPMMNPKEIAVVVSKR